jgi:hypothetical protein
MGSVSIPKEEKRLRGDEAGKKTRANARVDSA